MDKKVQKKTENRMTESRMSNAARRKYYRRRKRNRRIRRICRIMLLLLTAVGLAVAAGSFARGLIKKEGGLLSDLSGNPADLDVPDESPRVDLSGLYSPNAALSDAETGKLLAEQNGSERIYPASLTKIMTALLAVERQENMDDLITLPEEIFPPLYAQNASMAGFLPGETVTARDLLYGILLPSGAECCIAFARHIAGSEEAFVELMNQRARELGMEHTHFCNSTGLHDPDHYSTVEDLSVLLACALKRDAFREAFTAHRYSTRPSNSHPDGITVYSTTFQELESDVVTGGKILGGKTGYTGEAGLCLASLASVNGKEYILVTAGAEGNHGTEQFHTMDAVTVYDRLGEGK